MDRYIALPVVLEFLITPATLFIPFFSKARMPLHLPHVLERYGCFLLVVMGEIALGISQYLPTISRGSEAAVYAQSFIVLWALLLFKLLYFDLAEVHIDDHAMRINRSVFSSSTSASSLSHSCPDSKAFCSRTYTWSCSVPHRC